MRNKEFPQKKVLSLVLCVAVMLSVMVMGAGAAFSDQDKIENTEAVNMCTALNIIGGYPDGSYKPEGNIKRSEITKMICVALNGGKEPNVSTNTTPTFSDVRGTNAAWAEGYIESCVAQGIISGVGGGRFSPNGNVTGSQLAKMLLVSLGYNANTEGFVGNAWATNVNVIASQKGLYEGLESMDTSAALTRDNAAQMVWNAMNAYEVEYKTTIITDENGKLETIVTVQDKQVVNGDGKLARVTLLADKYNAIDDQSDILTGVSYNASKGEWTYTFKNGDTNVTGDKITSTVDYSDLYQQNVRVIYSVKGNTKTVDKVYGMFADDSSVIVSGVVGDIELVKGDTGKVEVNDTEYKLTKTTSEVDLYNFLSGNTGKNLNKIATYATKATMAYTFNLIDNTGDGEGDIVVVYPFQVAKVSYVGTDSFNIAANTEMNVSAATGIKFENVNSYDGIAKDDYVMIVDGTNSVDGKDTYTKIDVIEGKVTSISDDGAEINGTWYDKLDSGLKLGDTYKIAAVNGYVCAYETVTSGAEVSDYAVVTNAKGANDNGMLGDQAELLFTDGTKKIVDTDQDYSSMTGDLVTFEIEDGEYQLTEANDLTDGSNGNSGFDKKLSSPQYKYVSGGKSTLGGEFIANDAVVFVKDSANKYDVISGAALKRYSSGVNGVIGFADKASNGFNNVVLAYVTLQSEVSKATENYGYVTSNLTTTKNDDNETVSKLSMWTADGQLTDILADSNLSGKIAKGSVVTYEVNDDGSYTIAVASVNRAAVLAYNADTGAIRFTDSSMSATGTNEDLEVTSDTVILGINSDTNTGVEGAEITTAVETATPDVYQANAYYYTSNGTELDVIVVDFYADLPVMPGKVTSAATDEAGLQNALNSSTDVTYDGSKLAKAANVTVPAGTTLTVTDTDDTNALTVTVKDGATLKVEDKDVPDGKLVVNVSNGGNVELPNGALFGANGAAEVVSGSVELKAANSGGVTLTSSDAQIKLSKDLKIGNKDTVNLTGSALLIGDSGISISFGSSTTLTSTGNNFYASAGDAMNGGATAGAASTGKNYTWGTVYTGSSGSVVPANGWVQQ